MKFLDKMKRDKQGWFYVGMFLTILNGWFLHGLLSMLVSMLGIALVIYGVDDDKKTT